VEKYVHTPDICQNSTDVIEFLGYCEELGRFGEQIRNTWKVLKCGAGEGWKGSVGPIM
jgi:hypothetical protein